MRYKIVGEIFEVVTDYVANGSFKSLKDNVNYVENGYAALIRLVDYRNNFKNSLQYIDKKSYDFLSKTKLYGGEIVISNVGANAGTIFRVPKLGIPMSLGPNTITINTSEKITNDYYYYYFQSHNGQNLIHSIISGSAQPKFNKTDFKNLSVPYPSIKEQKETVDILNALDKKIELNSKINTNLFELVNVIFQQSFNCNGNIPLSHYFLPKRGKNLLKKNVEPGVVPVVAGGLKPAAYHNISNTETPVITISASGANAGYVQIWGQKVWSSDSSYIDSSITDNIYFWYIFLKSRQKQIFDAQTGSAQPHIYPKHIGNLLISELDEEQVQSFNKKVTPIFEKIFQNQRNNSVMEDVKNSLLYKFFNDY